MKKKQASKSQSSPNYHPATLKKKRRISHNTKKERIPPVTMIDGHLFKNVKETLDKNKIQIGPAYTTSNADSTNLMYLMSCPK